MRSLSAWLIPPVPAPDNGAGAIQHLRYRLYTHRKEIKQFLKFALVGTLGAIIDFTVLNILVLHFGWPKAAANVASFTVAVLSNFTWNRLWTFEHARHQPMWPQLGQFALVNLIGLGINEICFVGLDTYLFEPLFGAVLGYNLAKASATIIVLFWNFIINRLWTFRQRHQETAQ
ncbi:MAG: GtrA family protein [Anaerolineae bacterium]